MGGGVGVVLFYFVVSEQCVVFVSQIIINDKWLFLPKMEMHLCKFDQSDFGNWFCLVNQDMSDILKWHTRFFLPNVNDFCQESKTNTPTSIHA